MGRFKSPPAWKEAERHFPVRIRITQPEQGFCQRLNDMHRWLHKRAGLKGFFQWGHRSTAAYDDLVFYFEDLVVAREFVEQFDCAHLITVKDKSLPASQLTALASKHP